MLVPFFLVCFSGVFLPFIGEPSHCRAVLCTDIYTAGKAAQLPEGIQLLERSYPSSGN